LDANLSALSRSSVFVAELSAFRAMSQHRRASSPFIASTTSGVRASHAAWGTSVEVVVNVLNVCVNVCHSLYSLRASVPLCDCARAVEWTTRNARARDSTANGGFVTKDEDGDFINCV